MIRRPKHCARCAKQLREAEAATPRSREEELAELLTAPWTYGLRVSIGITKIEIATNKESE
jgi:hypothetical protein